MQRFFHGGLRVISSNGISSLWRTALWCCCLAVALPGCAPGEEDKAEKAEKTGQQVERKAPRKFQFEAPPQKVHELSGLTDEQQAALVRRVEEKWRAMERRDFATVYEYTTPNYRKVFSKPMFLNRFGSGVRWELTGIDILHYDADAAVASVGVRVMTESTLQTSLATSGVVSDTVKEKWFLIDGEWWNNAK